MNEREGNEIVFDFFNRNVKSNWKESYEDLKRTMDVYGDKLDDYRKSQLFNIVSEAIIVSDNIKEKLQEVVKNKELLKSLSENVYKLANEIIQQEGSINTESIIKKEYEKWKYLEQ